MRNTKKWITLALMLPFGVGMAQDNFSIDGNLSGIGSDKKVILSYVNSDGKTARDSATVINGKFKLSGTTAFGNKASLSLLPLERDTTRRNAGADYQFFYLEKGAYKVTGRDSINTAKITGTQVQKEFLAYSEKMDPLLATWRDISARFSKVYYAKEKDTVLIKAIQEEAKPVYAKMEKTLDEFIFSHPDSYVTVDLINTEKTAVIDSSFDRYYAVLSPRVLNSFTGQKLSAKYEKAKQIAIGRPVNFTLNDDKGKEFSLASLRGKYVLVDFWASWCVPCRAENPHLLKAYNQLKDKKFEIVGVSLDETKAAWEKAIKHDGMPWIQIGDLKGFKSDVAIRFGITAIPQNFLLNPEGVVVAKNLRGEDVNEQIRRLCKVSTL